MRPAALRYRTQPHPRSHAPKGVDQPAREAMTTKIAQRLTTMLAGQNMIEAARQIEAKCYDSAKDATDYKRKVEKRLAKLATAFSGCDASAKRRRKHGTPMAGAAGLPADVTARQDALLPRRDCYGSSRDLREKIARRRTVARGMRGRRLSSRHPRRSVASNSCAPRRAPNAPCRRVRRGGLRSCSNTPGGP